MSAFRFGVGAAVLCNMGQDGWKLGRVVALRYRESHWPVGTVAPYQVALDEDHTLIYVPQDDDGYCRKATPEDSRIARRKDALDALTNGEEEDLTRSDRDPADISAQLHCADGAARPGGADYRDGRCHGCLACPRSWSYAELYSEHYRCAARNGLGVTRRTVDLGTVRVGETVQRHAAAGLPSSEGFMQCPTLVRLPPGVRFFDDGELRGQVRFDPHRGPSYKVEFVAVSTAHWSAPSAGIVRLEVTLVVEGNDPPAGFDRWAFLREQDAARAAAHRTVDSLIDAWERWERGALAHRATCDRMCADLRDLRRLCEQHPRLDGGRWWALLGGFHMNVHKLLENTLFECELYLGYALTFGDAAVRRRAEQNLEGCYQKRLLEAARFLWNDGLQQMIRGEWTSAADTLRRAAAKKDGWGWAVNYGDIWLAESAARLVRGAELRARNGPDDTEANQCIAEAARLLENSVRRIDESRAFGPEGHPWASEITAALASHGRAQQSLTEAAEWLEQFRARTVYWCAQALGGAPPFPPRLRPRLEDAAALVERLPGHNA